MLYNLFATGRCSYRAIGFPLTSASLKTVDNLLIESTELSSSNVNIGDILYLLLYFK